MAAFAGVAIAVAVAIFARSVGFDRDRVFYPVILVVIASYYELFAIMGGGQALVAETIGFVLFTAAATLGFRTSLWIVVGALAAHGVFDFVHARLIDNQGVPNWWPAWCLAYDLAAASCLSALISTGAISDGATHSA